MPEAGAFLQMTEIQPRSPSKNGLPAPLELQGTLTSAA